MINTITSEDIEHLREASKKLSDLEQRYSQLYIDYEKSVENSKRLSEEIDRLNQKINVCRQLFDLVFPVL